MRRRGVPAARLDHGAADASSAIGFNAAPFVRPAASTTLPRARRNAWANSWSAEFVEEGSEKTVVKTTARAPPADQAVEEIRVQLAAPIAWLALPE